jgi:hypothetical protein
MRLRAAVVAIVLAALVAPSLAAAAASRQLTPGEQQQIGVLVDRFVKDAVRRENLAVGWALAGPALRGGTTRSAWISGKGVTVGWYPARGDDFRTAWTGNLIAPGHAVLSMMLHPEPGHPNVVQTAMAVDVIRRHGRWLVNGFYPAASFGPGGQVSGPNDFQAHGGGSAIGNDKSRISAHAAVVAIAAIGAVVLLVPVMIWVRVKRRERRAYTAYRA